MYLCIKEILILALITFLYYLVMEDLFKNSIIDYKILSQVLVIIENGRFGDVLSSLYFRASILNPYLIYSLNINLLKGKRIFHTNIRLVFLHMGSRNQE